MAKTREQLILAGYRDFYRFGRNYLYLWLALLATLVIVAIFGYRFLIRSDFEPFWPRHGRCRGRGCGFAIIGYFALMFFLTLPVWFKLPVSAFMGLNGLFGIIQKLSWILDSKPDLAIGSQGLYFPKRIKYRELYWKDISSIEIIRTRGKRGRISSPTMKFLGIAPTVRTLRSVGPLTAPLFCTIPPIYGFDYEAVLASIRELAPNVVIHEVEEAV